MKIIKDFKAMLSIMDELLTDYSQQLEKLDINNFEYLHNTIIIMSSIEMIINERNKLQSFIRKHDFCLNCGKPLKKDKKIMFCPDYCKHQYEMGIKRGKAHIKKDN